MKKQFFNKVTSILLVFVMVLALVPMTIPTVFAEEADVDLSADTLVIDSVADWKAVAGESASTDFAGKVVKLGGNIAFGEEAAPVLFSGTFAGTFYGNGYTVSGKTLAGKNLIATAVSGGTIDGGDGVEGSNKAMTITGFVVETDEQYVALVASVISGTSKIRNINISDCALTSTTSVAALIVSSAANDTPDSDPVANFDSICAEISNCNVDGCTLTVKSQGAFVLGAGNGNSYVTVAGCDVTDSDIVATQSGVAAIVGKTNAKSYVVVSNCSTASDVTITSSNLGNNNNWAFAQGMIVGQAGSNGTTVGQLTVANCTAAGNLSLAGGATAGGIVGSINLSGNNSISNCVSTVEFTTNRGNLTIGGILGNYHGCGAGALTISKCNVTGTVADATSSGGSPRMAGVLGRSQGTATGKTIIEQCYVDVDVSANSTYDKLGGIIGEWNTGSTLLFVRNSYYEGTVTSAKANAAAIIGTKGGNVTETTVYINDIIVNSAAASTVSTTSFTNVANNYTMNGNITNNGFVQIENSAITAESLIKRDANGFVESVRGYVNCNLVQLAKQADGKYAVRFIATSVFDDVSAATMSVSIGDYKFEVEESTIMDILEAYGESDAMTKINSEAYGAEKFCAIVVKNVDAENLADVVFTISFTATVEGAEYTANFTGSIPAEALV